MSGTDLHCLALGRILMHSYTYRMYVLVLSREAVFHLVFICCRKCIRAYFFECSKYSNSHQILPTSAEVLVTCSYQYLFYALLPIYTIIPDMQCILVSVYPSIFIATPVSCDPSLKPLNPLGMMTCTYIHIMSCTCAWQCLP